MTWSNRDEEKEHELTFSATFSLPSPSSDLKVPNNFNTTVMTNQKFIIAEADLIKKFIETAFL